MSGPTVTTADGTLVGEILANGTTAFKGIPFAAPPVGARRFAAPAPVEPWSGERDARRFGDAAVQVSLGGRGLTGMFGPGEQPTSEDCLTLNVWTPGLDDARRPVMVWIHGGAFRLGTSASPLYDGAGLSARGDVVVVSLNYRLGLLGFLASPELDAANAGLLDQVAALAWVQREIERFGGDPGQVTIFGESAGAKSVECLLAMPSARGLFHRAILQSTYGTTLDMETASERTLAIAAELGIRAGGLDELRHAPLDALLGAEAAVLAAAGPPAAGRGGGGPVVDGTSLPQAPLDAVAAGAASDVPLLLGTTLDEHLLFAMMGAAAGAPPVDGETLAARLAPLLGATDPADPVVDAAIEAYRQARRDRGADPDDAAGIHADAMTDRTFRQHSIRVAEAAARHGHVHAYLFTWPSPIEELGSCHGLELGFVFGTIDTLAGFAGEGPDADALSDTIQSAWISFARGGRPSADTLPEWPAYDTDRRATMILGRECAVQDAPMDTIRALWERVEL